MPDNHPDSLPTLPNEDRSRIRAAFLTSFGWAGVLILFHVLPGVHDRFETLGVHPRAWAYLYTPATWALVHGSWEHLFSNLAALIPLSGALVYLYQPIAARSLATLWLVSGLWVWLFAPTYSVHGGASGVIYGMAAFLFASGVLRRDRRALVVAAFTALFYGGMIWGILPHQPGVSWQGHFFGGLVGLMAAWFWRKEGLPPPPPYPWQLHDDDPNNEGLWNYRRHFPPPGIPAASEPFSQLPPADAPHPTPGETP